MASLEAKTPGIKTFLASVLLPVFGKKSQRRKAPSKSLDLSSNGETVYSKVSSLILDIIENRLYYNALKSSYILRRVLLTLGPWR